jgi:hypothetical protein
MPSFAASLGKLVANWLLATELSMTDEQRQSLDKKRLLNVLFLFITVLVWAFVGRRVGRRIIGLKIPAGFWRETVSLRPSFVRNRVPLIFSVA